MFYAINRTYLLDNTYSLIDLVSDIENANVFKERVKEYIETIKELIEVDFKKISDEDFFELLYKFYYISIDKNDYLKIISKLNCIKYVSYEKLPTKMTFIATANEGHGRSFDFWDQLYQVYYNVVATKEFNFDFNKIYSKDEIKRLVNNKQIILLNAEHEAVEDSCIDFDKEEYEELETLKLNIRDYNSDITQFLINNFSLFGELLRKKFTKKKVLNDIKESLKDFEEDLNSVFSLIKYEGYDSSYASIAKLCKEWFELSNEKKEYEVFNKKLKIK